MPQLAPVPASIQDYALLGDCLTAALVSPAGSIDWLCWPRFDGDACFAALLGTPEHGRWQVCPASEPITVTRAYRDGSTVVETLFETASGAVALIDFMPRDTPASSVIRIAKCRRGTVQMQMRLKLRFDYGTSIPWVTNLPCGQGSGIVAIAGPSLVALRASVPLEGRDLETVADFTLAENEEASFVLSHGPSHLDPPAPLDARAELARTEAIWRGWSDRCATDGPHAALVKRSLITLKALTYAPTGGIVAAPTTSLPEVIGGGRNWDYRYCWLRDATLTLFALMDVGFYEEAQAWGDWLHLSIAGSPAQLQIMYGIAGERRLAEAILPWLPGYRGSGPVRIGNEAAAQVQLDVFGEVMRAYRQARLGGLVLPPEAWSLQKTLLAHLTRIWREPDEGMWEVRGGRRHFTFSKVAAWSAYDNALADAAQWDLDGDIEAWRAEREEIRALVMERGYSPARNSFTQSFGSDRLDANLLLLPMAGFIERDDPRMLGTIAAIEATLLKNGLVCRYEPDETLDGQAGAEGAFLACSFWLANTYALQGRTEEARALFDRLVGLANDVGLLAEEYDTAGARMVGNFPQAFSHLALVTTAIILRDGKLPGR